MQAVIFGDGPMGRALAHALTERGDAPRIVGRPDADSHPPHILAAAEVAFEASVGSAVRSNLEAALAAGCRAVVIATTTVRRRRIRLSLAGIECPIQWRLAEASHHLEQVSQRRRASPGRQTLRSRPPTSRRPARRS